MEEHKDMLDVQLQCSLDVNIKTQNFDWSRNSVEVNIEYQGMVAKSSHS